MLQGEHSAKLSAFINVPFVVKTFVLSFFEWPFYTGYTVHCIFTPYFMPQPPTSALRSSNNYVKQPVCFNLQIADIQS